ncbi:hypothetical protein D3C86_2081180 [compost metagenome]
MDAITNTQKDRLRRMIVVIKVRILPAPNGKQNATVRRVASGSGIVQAVISQLWQVCA